MTGRLEMCLSRGWETSFLADVDVRGLNEGVTAKGLVWGPKKSIFREREVSRPKLRNLSLILNSLLSHLESEESGLLRKVGGLTSPFADLPDLEGSVWDCLSWEVERDLEGCLNCF